MSLSCLASFPFFISPFWYKWLCKVTEKEVYILLSILQDLENSERLQQGTWCYLVYPRVHQGSPRSLPSTPAGYGFLMAVVLHPAAHREISQVSKQASACVGNSFKMSPHETRNRWQKNLTIQPQVSSEKVCLCSDNRGPEVSLKLEFSS